ncbi:hypothetical protein K443DRAFT_681826 [Laccaria amethystina LaAM-08-1]|uniref:Uncharacterized protein n=1 Tax=Laccaria amethystina LaAM-08-1 TaxID=1095629 RepID=A0A0C9WWQ8_9AGAR|nr:hypothetical protein K443DRAFT_681826 [Laccaria amethystina LaAM-08-1]
MHSTSAATSSSFTTATIVCASLEHSSPTTTPTHKESDSNTCVNHSSPQCCHCGWRGSHAANCPFR